jgi:glycosyltransferase involved in cell wall biosynthesis
VGRTIVFCGLPFFRLHFAFTPLIRTPENDEVAGGAGIPFEPGELVAKLRLVFAMTEAGREALRRRAMDRVRERYSWDAVTDAYESLLKRLAARNRSL